MWKIVPLFILLFYVGKPSALPIAAVRSGFNITLPRPAQKIVPAPQKFVTNRSKEETFEDVARIMKEAQKSPFRRYGKRATMTDTLFTVHVEKKNDSNQKMFSGGGFPQLNGITRQPFFPEGYAPFYYFQKARKMSLPTIPGFDSATFAAFIDVYLYRGHLVRFNDSDISRLEQIELLDKLIDGIEKTSNPQNTIPIKKIKNHYQTTYYTRARPGKRSASLQKQQHFPIIGPFNVLVPLGENGDDASSGILEITVVQKRAVAFTQDDFRQGSEPTTVGGN